MDIARAHPPLLRGDPAGRARRRRGLAGQIGLERVLQRLPGRGRGGAEPLLEGRPAPRHQLVPLRRDGALQLGALGGRVGQPLPVEAEGMRIGLDAQLDGARGLVGVQVVERQVRRLAGGDDPVELDVPDLPDEGGRR